MKDEPVTTTRASSARASSARASSAPASSSQAPAFDAWLKQFWSSYRRHRPVNATFIGWHDGDARLPDMSAAGVAAVYGDAEALLARLDALPAEPLSPGQALDRQLAAGYLRIQRWELMSGHFGGGNPSLYTGEAAFGVLSLLRRPFAPLGERLDSAAERMEAIPALLSQGQANIAAAPRAWIDKAADECLGLLALLRGGVQQLMRESGLSRPDVEAAAERAAAGVEAYQAALAELDNFPSDGYAAGEEALDLLIRDGHFLPYSADEIAAHAEATIAECEAELREGARALGAGSPAEVLARLADLHPPADGYYRRYAELWDACRDAALHHGLVSWPDYPISYVPRPAWVRSAAPHLYFLFYHAAAPFDPPAPFEYLVTPVEPDMPHDEQQRLLRANNDSVIKLNHVVHHGALGHHVQNWYAYNRAASSVGKVAAVDCASRIAMFCGGTMAEGWACYATDQMAEVGFLTPLERYSERHGRLRMAARALTDVRLHSGAWTLDQAAGFYEQRVGMAPTAARGEAIKNSMFPGTALMYLMGTDTIWNLRRTLEARPGFDLERFHDRLLSFGSVPVALAAATMTAQTDSAGDNHDAE